MYWGWGGVWLIWVPREPVIEPAQHGEVRARISKPCALPGRMQGV